MGRELKRVPADFDWPLEKVWKGFQNPYGDTSVKCDACDGTSHTAEYNKLYSMWYSHMCGGFFPELRGRKPYIPDHPVIQRVVRGRRQRDQQETSRSIYQQRGGSSLYLTATEEEEVREESERLCRLFNSAWSHHLNQLDVDALLEADRLWDFTYRPITAEHRLIVKRRVESRRCNSWLPFSNGYHPTAQEVNDWALFGMGHDSCNSWIVVGAECKRLGYSTCCPKCEGEGTLWPDAQDKANYENWKREQPPTGEAYQVWETVSEGSPISPPFTDPSSLAAFMVMRYPMDGDYQQWMKFILGRGWTPSMTMSAKGIKVGAQITDDYDEDEPVLPKMTLVVEAAVLGMAHTMITRKRLRKWVRQERKAAAIEEARRQKEREIERAEAA